MQCASYAKLNLLLLTLAAVLYGCTDKKADQITPDPDDPGITCDTANLSFSADIMPILQQSCATVGCHNASTRAGGYNMNNFAGFDAAVKKGRVRGAINHQSGYVSMPQMAAKLSDCEITKIEHWITIGSPDN